MLEASLPPKDSRHPPRDSLTSQIRIHFASTKAQRPLSGTAEAGVRTKGKYVLLSEEVLTQIREAHIILSKNQT